MCGMIVAVASAAGVVSLVPAWGQHDAGAVAFADQFVDLYQLFSVTWATAPSIPGWQDQFPFQLGFVAITFGSVTFWGWLSVSKTTLSPTAGRLLVFGYVGIAVLLLLVMAFTAPIWQLTGGEQLLTYPWQLLLIAAPLLAAVAGALPAVLPGFSAPPTWAALATLVVLASYGYLAPSYTQVEPAARPAAVLGANQVLILDSAAGRDNRATDGGTDRHLAAIAATGL